MKILVLAGGDSAEREVSLASGRAITKSLQRLGHSVSVIDPASGETLLGQDGKFLLDKDTESSSRIALKPTNTGALAAVLNTDDYNDADIIFLGLHGGTGEDGTIQALLDLAGKKYTGSSMLASAISMNKDIAKRILKAEDILTPDWMLVKRSKYADLQALHSEVLNRFSPPFIVKPNNGGSTVGLTLVKDKQTLADAFKNAFDVTSEVLVEEYIKGREITAAVLDGKVLPLVEIVPANELYDYQCKYTKDESEYICPAKIPGGAARRIQEMAGIAFETIGCSGVARVDFILNDRNKPHFLEVNTLPGMTELSLVPMAAKEAGIGFDDLMQRLCELAIKK